MTCINVKSKGHLISYCCSSIDSRTVPGAHCLTADLPWALWA